MANVDAFSLFNLINMVRSMPDVQASRRGWHTTTKERGTDHANKPSYLLITLDRDVNTHLTYEMVLAAFQSYEMPNCHHIHLTANVHVKIFN